MNEWEAAFYAYRAAQARMATSAAYLALLEWERALSPTDLSANVSWLRYVVRIMRGTRRRQQMLAQAYLQYARALDIQQALGLPLTGVPSPRLGAYRDVFLEGLQDAALMGSNSLGTSWPDDPDWDFILSELRSIDPDGVSANARSVGLSEIDMDRHIQEFLDSWTPDGPVQVLDFNWPPFETDANDVAHERWLRELIRELERELRDKARVRDALADEDGEPPSREKVVQEAYGDFVTGGNKVAGQVMAATSDAADQVTNWATRTDRKIRAVARGTTATPCAFCAMLASRGFKYAGNSFGEGDMTTAFRRVHPNCQCYPIIRWVDASELPELNRRFRQMWDAAPGAGDAKFNAFRRALYAGNKDAINTKRRRAYQDRKFQDAWKAAR